MKNTLVIFQLLYKLHNAMSHAPCCLIVGLSLSIISFTCIDQHKKTTRTYPYKHVLSSSRNRSNLNVPLFACYLNKSHLENHFETNHDQTHSFVTKFEQPHVMEISEYTYSNLKSDKLREIRFT